MFKIQLQNSVRTTERGKSEVKLRKSFLGNHFRLDTNLDQAEANLLYQNVLERVRPITSEHKVWQAYICLLYETAIFFTECHTCCRYPKAKGY